MTVVEMPDSLDFQGLKSDVRILSSNLGNFEKFLERLSVTVEKIEDLLAASNQNLAVYQEKMNVVNTQQKTLDDRLTAYEKLLDDKIEVIKEDVKKLELWKYSIFGAFFVLMQFVSPYIKILIQKLIS